MSTDDQELKRILSINNNRLNRDVALRTVAAGMPVFPVKAEKIANQRYSFVPLFASAPRSATKHLGIIEGWWSHTIRAIPAIPCADIVVIRTHRFYSGFDGVAAFEALIGDQ